MMDTAWLPARALVDAVVDALEALVAAVPESREQPVVASAIAVRALARKSAARAAAVSGTLALPPGLLGMLTVVPDLVAIWRIQAQMVSDIAGLHGRRMRLTRTHMLYCLFRHAASHVTRDFVVRAGDRFVVRQLSGGALRSVLASLGLTLTERVAGTAASRWVPLFGAAAVAGYAYFDTLQVARSALRMLELPALSVEEG
jgi:hypothetical protein